MGLRRQEKQVLVVAVVMCVVGSAFVPGVGSAADDLITQGIKLRRANRDQEALKLFQEAVKEQPSPRASAQLGLCEHAMGLWVEAEAHLQDALKAGSDPWIAKNAPTLRADLDRVQEKLGSVEIWGTPAGADVSMDGHLVGKLPLEGPLRALGGRRLVLVEAAGYLSDTRTIEVTAGSVTREHFALGALAPPVAVAALGPAGGASVDATAEPMVAKSALNREAQPAPDAGAQQTAFYQHWWFWAALGTVAIVAGGSAFLLTRHNDNCPGTQGSSCVAW